MNPDTQLASHLEQHAPSFPSADSLLESLKRSEFLGDVPTPVLVQLLQESEVCGYPAGVSLFNQEEKGDALYLILGGEVTIVKDGIVITRRGPGECVGEMVLLDDAPRSAAVVATVPTQTLRVPREVFWQLLHSSPGPAEHLLRVLSRRIRQDLQRELQVMQETIAQQRELKRAAEIQRQMFPSEDLDTPHVHLAGWCEPAESVGGDYYDYFFLPDGRVACLLADVMGHGLQSALLVAMLHSAVHTQARADASIEAMISALEQVLLDFRTPHFAVYATCCYLVFQEDRLFFVNAGHPPPVMFRDGRCTELPTTRVPLGWSFLQQDASPVEVLDWRPGDELYLYSDGLYEAVGLNDEPFGLERLHQLLQQQEGTAMARREVLQALRDFQRSMAQEDDMTLVEIRYR